MKKNLKWLSALALMLVGAFVFVSCGDEEEENSKTPLAQNALYGTWEVSSVSNQKEGPSKGALIYFGADNQTAKYAEGNHKAIGYYRYDATSGTLSLVLPMVSVEGFVTGDSEKASIAYIQDDGQTGTAVLKKKSSNDLIGDTGNDPQPDPDEPTIGGKVDAKEMVGEWVVTVNSDEGATGQTMIFKENGTGRMDNQAFSYSNRWDDGRIKCDIYFTNGIHTFCKFILVQNGNVLTGTAQDDGDPTGMLVMTKPGYTIPSDGILGRWEITGPQELNDPNNNGPQIGMVMVFGQDGELYIEGDPHLYNYNWNEASSQLYLSMVDAAGTLTVRGQMVTGAEAVWTLGEQMRVELKKL